MMSEALSLREYVGGQLGRLCAVVGIQDVATPTGILGVLLGAAGERLLQGPPLWPSDIADDATPVEFSIAFDRDGALALRLSGETIASRPGVHANARACLRGLILLAEQYGVSFDRFHQIQDLFLPEAPGGDFGLWYSVILRPDSVPEFKIYFNPDVRGRCQASVIVAEALRRLGLDLAHPLVTEHAVQRHQLDRFCFFGLDLHAQPQSRVKVYVAHHDAGPDIALRAAGAVPGVAPAEVAEFISLIGAGIERFVSRPLVSCFAFTDVTPAAPNNYTLHVPIREVVSDDEIARERVAELMTRHGLDPMVLDGALAAVSSRAPRAGVGLISYVSLRLGPARPGLTIYLSSEAYHTTPPRPRISPRSLTNAR